MKRFACLTLIAVSVIASAVAQAPTASNSKEIAEPQPVYFYLYSKVTDHINMDITEARLRRLLPMIEQYRKDNPGANITATIFFSGAVGHALVDRNKQTGIEDLVLRYKNMGVIEIGYDGSDEPTYDHRPMIDESIEQKPYQARYLERAQDDEKFLTEDRDPLTGEIRPGSAGGLKALQQVFGPVACISSVSVGEKASHPLTNAEARGWSPTYSTKAEVGDWEVVPVLRHYNTDAILFGFSAANRDFLPGYGGSVRELGRILSPEPDTAPELYWADNVLRFSEAGGGGSRLVQLTGGVDAIKKATANLDRSRIHIFHVELDNENDYLSNDFTKEKPFTPALTYAYAHPDRPLVPADARLNPADIDATFAKEQEALKWIISEYVPTSAGNGFVSNNDLRRMTPKSLDFDISTNDLRAGLKKTIADLGNADYLPPYLYVGGRYLSLAEGFQVMADALAEMSKKGSLPDTLHVVRVYGPIAMPMGHGPNTGDVSVASIAKLCADLVPVLHDDTGYPLPKNAIPSIVSVDGIRMNAAQLLRLMAQAIVDPTPATTLHVRMVYMLPGTAQVFPKARNLEDVGATWTLKPAPLRQIQPKYQQMNGALAQGRSAPPAI